MGFSADIKKQLQAVGEIEELDKIMQRARLLVTLTKKKKLATVK